jgi:hypothetical protein
MQKICEQLNNCVGFSNVKKRIYVTRITGNEPNNVEVIRVGGPFRHYLPAAIPIGGESQNVLDMGTLTWYAQDSQGNWYGITDGHVLDGFSTVYFPPPLVFYNKQYLGLNVPLIKPVPIGTVTQYVQYPYVDLGVFKLNVKPHLVSYGGVVPINISQVFEGEQVLKIGARTGATLGIVLDQSATVTIAGDQGTIQFTGPLFQMYSQPGDSGGPVFQFSGALVSSIVAGTGSYAIGNSIANIVAQLKAWGLQLKFMRNLEYLTVPISAIWVGSLGVALGLA